MTSFQVFEKNEKAKIVLAQDELKTLHEGLEQAIQRQSLGKLCTGVTG
jgi:hypothetical protein